MFAKNSISTFKVILTQIGQGVLLIENPHQVTSHLWEEILSLGGVKNRRWLLYLVQKRSLEVWLNECVSFSG